MRDDDDAEDRAKRAKHLLQPVIDETNTKIRAAFVDIPRGKYVGVRDGGDPQSEAEHFYKCAECGGWVDKRDLGSVFDHESGGSHPATDRPSVEEELRCR